MPAGPALGAWVRLGVKQTPRAPDSALQAQMLLPRLNSPHIAPRPYVESGDTRSILGSTIRTKSL